MSDHVSLQVTDLAASRVFYEKLLAPLGISVTMDFGEVLGFGTPTFPFFWLGPPEDPTGPRGRGIHLAFAAPDLATVRAGPRRRDRGAPRASGVLEAVCHQPES